MPSSKARKIGEQGAPVGHLVWFSVPETTAHFDDLKDLAYDVGLDEAYTPDSPTARDAWRKATNTGKRGIRVPTHMLDQQLVKDYEARDWGTPRVYIQSIEISRAAPELVRHLVLFAVVPGADNKREQLGTGSVAVLTFDTETERARADVDTYNQKWVSQAYVNKVVDDINDELHDRLDRADNNRIRASIRDMLEDFHRTCLKNTGGVYFIPRSAAHILDNGDLMTAQDGLDAMKRWVDGMEAYAADPDEAPMFRRVILDGENASELQSDILASAIAQYKGSLQAIADSLKPVFEHKVKGLTAEKILQNAQAALGQTVDGARAYRDSLDLDLEELSAMLRMASESVQKAMAEVQGQDADDVSFDDIMALLSD